MREEVLFGEQDEYRANYVNHDIGDVFSMFEDLFMGSAQYAHQQQHYHQGDIMGSFFNMYTESTGRGSASGQQFQEMFHEPHFEATATETPLRSGEIIMPYSPIIMSGEMRHFAFLDAACSFGVYSYEKGGFRHFTAAYDGGSRPFGSPWSESGPYHSGRTLSRGILLRRFGRSRGFQCVPRPPHI